MKKQSTVASMPSNRINIQATREHIAKLIVSHGFDPYSEQVLEQTITMLEHFEDLLFDQPEVS